MVPTTNDNSYSIIKNFTFFYFLGTKLLTFINENRQCYLGQHKIKVVEHHPSMQQNL